MGRCAPLEFLYGSYQPLDVFGAGEPVIAILDQRQNYIVAGKTRNKFYGVPPRHIRIFDALQDMHRTARFYQTTEQQMPATILDQCARDRIGLLPVR